MPDLSWIADTLSRFSLDDLWVWMAVLAAGLVAIVSIAHVLEATVDAS